MNPKGGLGKGLSWLDQEEEGCIRQSKVNDAVSPTCHSLHLSCYEY